MFENHQPELVNMLVFHDVSSSWATLDEQTDDIFHRILLKKNASYWSKIQNPKEAIVLHFGFRVCIDLSHRFKVVLCPSIKNGDLGSWTAGYLGKNMFETIIYRI